MNEATPPTNRLAIISLTAGILTVISFCGGVVPIPGTGWFCFPAAVLLGLAALLTGLPALYQARRRGERGGGMALAGALLGGLSILATFCAIALTISALTAIGIEVWNQAVPQLFATPTP
jgi:hypothetical protein